MGNKHKHKLKEIERLRALYGEVQAKESEPTISSEVSSTPVTTTVSDDHGYIKKDLVGLVVLIIVMLAVLVGFNWLVANTGFSSWLFGLLGV